ncbi:hypothetical protein ACWGJ6_16530 [Streptomyces canus]
MGYDVMWTGEDLHRQLRKDSLRILDRPFAAFVVALATEVDREALEWLTEYRMAIDSATGPEVAFITFCNSNIRLMRRERGSRGGVSYFHYSYESEIPTVDVPNGSSAESYLPRADWTGEGPPAEVFARTMTYESDSFARALGLHSSELPCLVFFDEPSSDHYYLVSMRLPPEELIVRVRNIVSDYHLRARDCEYFRILSEWRDREVRVIGIDDEIRAYRHSVDVFERVPGSVDFSGHDLLECLNRIRHELASACRSAIPEGLHRPLEGLLSKEQQKALLAWQQLIRSRGRVCEIRAALEAGEPVVGQARMLRRTYSRVLSFLDPANEKPCDFAECMAALERLATAEDDPRIVEIDRMARNLQSALADMRRAGIERTREVLRERVNEAEQIQREMIALEERLQRTVRPSMEETFGSLRWVERRRRAVQSASSIGTSVSTHSELLFKVLSFLGIGG